MNLYEAKFAREAKENPTDWVITPIPGRLGRYELVRSGTMRVRKHRRTLPKGYTRRDYAATPAQHEKLRWYLSTLQKENDDAQ